MFGYRIGIFGYSFSRNSFRFLSNQIESNTASNVSPSDYKRRIFSAIQPTGKVHLGNYLGAVRQWVKLQEEESDVSYCIADLHSLTLTHDPKLLSSNILAVTATLLACGINPKKSILFQQSDIQQHSELLWHLCCIATMARLSHFHQFKEKSATLKDVPLSLFVYPVLQAADILLYKATHVPVGEDQFQHLELCQSLARMFNRRFGKTFPYPNIVVADSGSAKVKSLRDPSKKMSKSDPDSKSCIFLTDSPDDIVLKIRKSVTDSNSQITYDPEKRPGVSNLICIHSLLTKKTVQEICDESTTLDTLQYKNLVADVIIQELAPIQEKVKRFNEDPTYLQIVLKEGAEKAGIIAEETAQEIRQKLGLRPDLSLSKKARVLNN